MTQEFEKAKPLAQSGIRFVKNDDGNVNAILTTPRGMELPADASSDGMKAVISQALDNVTDGEQAMFSMDLADRVFEVMEKRGIKVEDKDHAAAIEYLSTVIVKWIETEKLVRTGKQLKLEEAALDSIAIALTLPDKEFQKLNPAIKEATQDVIQGVTLASLTEVADERIVATAKNLLDAHRLLMERKVDLRLMQGRALGSWAGGLIGAGTENIIRPVTRALYGGDQEEGTKGLLPATVDTLSDATQKLIEHGSDALGRLKRGATQNWKAPKPGENLKPGEPKRVEDFHESDE